MYLRAVGRRFTQINAYFLVMNSKRCILKTWILTWSRRNNPVTLQWLPSMWWVIYKSASFSTDNGQKSRFSFSYRISNNKNFIPKYLDNALKVLLKLHEHRGDRIGEKSSCERFCKVPVPRIIGNGVISLLWQLRCHCNPDDDKFSS